MEKNYFIIAILGMAIMFGGCNKGKLPSVETAAVTHITVCSAECGGTVSDNGTSVMVRGVCWSESPNPTIDNPHSTDGSGTGSFSSLIKNLSPGTTYYVRAYAMNDNGIAYGTENIFNTLGEDAMTPTDVLCNPKGWRMSSASCSPAYPLNYGNGPYITNLMEGFFNDSELDDILVFRSDGTRWVYDNLNDFHNGSGQPIGQWFFDNLDNPQNLYYSADSNPLKIIELTANRFIIEYEYDKTFWHPAKDDYYHGTFVISYISAE